MANVPEARAAVSANARAKRLFIRDSVINSSCLSIPSPCACYFKGFERAFDVEFLNGDGSFNFVFRSELSVVVESDRAIR